MTLLCPYHIIFLLYLTAPVTMASLIVQAPPCLRTSFCYSLYGGERILIQMNTFLEYFPCFSLMSAQMWTQWTGSQTTLKVKSPIHSLTPVTPLLFPCFIFFLHNLLKILYNVLIFVAQSPTPLYVSSTNAGTVATVPGNAWYRKKLNEYTLKEWLMALAWRTWRTSIIEKIL